MQKGKFIVFEGIDGSGKSTQIRLLHRRLTAAGIRCVETFEPSGGPVGALVNQIMTKRMRADERVIASLFAADRLDHILNEQDGLLKVIESGITVLSDRYYFSSYAYNGVSLPMEWIIELNAQCAELLRPDLNVFIDIDPEKTLKRIENDRVSKELYETYERLSKVRENYFSAFSRFEGKENITVVDGDRPPELIADEIWEKVKGCFNI